MRGVWQNVCYFPQNYYPEFAAEHCFERGASIYVYMMPSVHLWKMLAINENVNSVRARLTNLNVITQRHKIWAILQGVWYKNILLFKIRNRRQRCVLSIVNHKFLRRSHEKWIGNLTQSYGCGDLRLASQRWEVVSQASGSTTHVKPVNNCCNH